MHCMVLKMLIIAEMPVYFVLYYSELLGTVLLQWNKE